MYDKNLLHFTKCLQRHVVYYILVLIIQILRYANDKRKWRNLFLDDVPFACPDIFESYLICLIFTHELNTMQELFTFPVEECNPCGS